MNDAHRIPYESMMVHSFFQLEEEEEEEDKEEEEEERGFVTR